MGQNYTIFTLYMKVVIKKNSFTKASSTGNRCCTGSTILSNYHVALFVWLIKSNDLFSQRLRWSWAMFILLPSPKISHSFFICSPLILGELIRPATLELVSLYSMVPFWVTRNRNDCIWVFAHCGFFFSPGLSVNTELIGWLIGSSAVNCM
jgi:hypothetical protein